MLKNLAGMLALATILMGCSKAPRGNPALPGSPLAPPTTTTEPTENLDELLAKAKNSAEAGELGDAIESLERAVMLDPSHRSVLFQLTQYTLARSKSVAQREPALAYQLMVQSGGYLRMLRAAHKDLTDEEKEFFAQVLFDEACAHGRSNRQEEALGSLRDAIAAGFQDFNRLHSEPDLNNLREVSGFKKLLEDHPAAGPPGNSSAPPDK